MFLKREELLLLQIIVPIMTLLLLDVVSGVGRSRSCCAGRYRESGD